MIADKLVNWWPSMLTFGTIVYLTCWPDPLSSEVIPIFPRADKLVHAIMFGGMVGALNFDYFRHHGSLPMAKRITFLTLTIIFGLITELIQSIEIVGRSCDYLDFIADIVGCVIAFFTAPPVVKTICKSHLPNK